jgi:hypothetical protein
VQNQFTRRTKNAAPDPHRPRSTLQQGDKPLPISRSTLSTDTETGDTPTLSKALRDRWVARGNQVRIRK